MDDGIFILFTLAVAFLFSFAAVPLVRVLAFKIKAVDVPRDNRRMHTKPIPRMGGLAIYLGFLVAYMCFVGTVEKETLGEVLIRLFPFRSLMTFGLYRFPNIPWKTQLGNDRFQKDKCCISVCFLRRGTGWTFRFGSLV